MTSITLTPGMRAHLGNNWFFLAGLPIPVTKQRVADVGVGASPVLSRTLATTNPIESVLSVTRWLTARVTQ
jgi:hypothetical protein